MSIYKVGLIFTGFYCQRNYYKCNEWQDLFIKIGWYCTGFYYCHRNFYINVMYDKIYLWS